MPENFQTRRQLLRSARENDFLLIGAPRIGAGTWIGRFCVIDGSGGLTIGRNCDISCGVHIYTHDTIRRCLSNRKFLRSGRVDRTAIARAPVSIGDHTFIGANAVVLKGVSIGNRCVIGANAVVTRDVPDDTVFAAAPGRILTPRRQGMSSSRRRTVRRTTR